MLEQFKVKKVKELGSWSASTRLDSHCITELNWWVDYLKLPIVESLQVYKHTQVVYSDASDIGFGSMWNDEKFQGLFTPQQKSLSINTKELLAIYYTLSTHAHRFHNEVVLLRCDNMTAIYCIESFGSRDFLRDTITKKIFALADIHTFKIQISYVPSAENISDYASRIFNGRSVHTEWTLSKLDFNRILELSTISPDIDMFASKNNTQLPRFISWVPEH